MGFTICYPLYKGLYINLTNRCTNRCDFCIRNNPDGISKGLDLWLDREPTAEEIVTDLKKYDISKFSEVVFCGYGEPFLKLDEIIEVSRFIRSISDVIIRVNTNGQANLYFGQDVTYRLEGLVDVCSISMNASSATEYQKICHSQYGQKAFDAMIDFAKSCKKHVEKVLFTVVDVLEVDEIKKCSEIAKNAGVDFRVRQMID